MSWNWFKIQLNISWRARCCAQFYIVRVENLTRREIKNNTAVEKMMSFSSFSFLKSPPHQHHRFFSPWPRRVEPIVFTQRRELKRFYFDENWLLWKQSVQTSEIILRSKNKLYRSAMLVTQLILLLEYQMFSCNKIIAQSEFHFLIERSDETWKGLSLHFNNETSEVF